MRAITSGVTYLLSGVVSAASLLPDIGSLTEPVGDDSRRHLKADGRTLYSVGTEPAEAMSGVKLSVVDGAIVVDNRKAPPALRKTNTRIPTIRQKEFPADCYALRAVV